MSTGAVRSPRSPQSVQFHGIGGHLQLAPAIWQHRGLQVDPVDAETVEFLKRRELTGDALYQVSQTSGLGVVIGDRKDVDLNGHGGLGWEVLLPIGAEN